MTQNIDLEYLINTQAYEKYLQKNNNKINNDLESEKKFYKKRISAMTKSLFKKNNYPQEVKDSFNNYVASCIEYFRFTDTSDIIQNDYKEIKNQNQNQNQNENKNKNQKDINEITKKLLKVNKKENATIENFVEIKKSKEKEIIIPKERKINIKDEQHRKKGLKKSKPIYNE